MQRMGTVVSQVSVDAHDPLALARWWADVLGWTVVPDEDEGTVDLLPPDGAAATPWIFVPVPDDKRTKNRLHLDLRPADDTDQATEHARLLALGAVPADVGQGDDVSWHVLADPEGNEFCLLSRTPAQVARDAAAG